MHGNPTFRLAIVAVAYLLAGLAVWRVTQPTPVRATTPAAAVTAPAGPKEVRPVRVALTFSTEPTVFEVRHLGRTLIGGEAVMDQLGDVESFDLEIALPPEGIDLVLQATWPAGGEPVATRLRVWVDGRQAVDETFWATSELAEAVTVRYGGGAP